MYSNALALKIELPLIVNILISFVKKKELTDAFEQSCAYPELLVELINNAEEAANFINGIVPKTIQNAE